MDTQSSFEKVAELWKEKKSSEVEEKKPEKEIWLYYDCSGVAIDNGLKQFCHDITMSDGVDRHYVLTDKK
jgi:hypothetical protein